MNSKTNRVNHDFQIVYFLVGSCHTADGAYALLCDLRDDRELALKSVLAGKLRGKAKRIKAERMMKSDDEVVRLEGEADLAELDAFAELEAKNIAAAEAELKFIGKCIEKVQPLRKFAHLHDPEAHEAAQHDEWRLELIRRAENHLLMHGTIPPEEFATMRMHPDYLSDIAPKITTISQAINTIGRDVFLASYKGTKKDFDLPLLLGNEATNKQSQPEL